MSARLATVAMLAGAAACAGSGGRPAPRPEGARVAVPSAPTPETPRTDAARELETSARTPAEVMAALCDGPGSFPLEVMGSRHFVRVELAGPKATQEVLFHVDTGGNTPGLMLRKTVADRLGFSSAADLPAALRMAGRDVAVPVGASWVVYDEPAELGEKALRKDLSAGQIGAGFLSRHAVCIDPGRGRFGLAPAGSIGLARGAIETGAPDVHMVPFMPMTGGANRAVYPFVHVLIRDRGEFRGGYGVLVDTGATTSMLEAGKVKRLCEVVSTALCAEGAAGDADMIGSAFEERLVRVTDVAIGAPGNYRKTRGLDRVEHFEVGATTFVSRPDGTFSKMFGDVPFTMGSHGAVANDVLGRFRILVDYAGERLFLQPVEVAPHAAASASTSRIGVSITFDDAGCPVVRGLTRSNAPRTLAALEKGDVIVSVGSADACRMLHHELSRALAGAPGDEKSLTVRRKGARRTVRVPVVELLVPGGRSAG